ncbi:neural-cadherin-like isoform X2 [Penaeus monodon]|uniref:neural-cadherin-like isoform X2 n=1 Tax=Penaeus monodon TaxID=6687 RepID=UPI0018A7658A|nr:neural-cadherin-like isoform X2 [Penaeus monodon]
MVQVTDRGRGGWEDARHTDTAWVSVKLRDLNDNPPTFSRSHAHVTVQEDAAPGTVLAVLTAQDPDMDGQESVEYRVESAWDSLNVNTDGEVRLWRRLDREAPGGAEGVARIIGVDNGRPPLSATATLTITVTDVNDCPPRLLPPTIVHVTESSPPTRLATLAATDLDVWAMGHGPPFNFSLARTNPAHVKALIKIKFRQNLDSGRGGAEVWTTGSVDREEHRRLDVHVWLSDAGGMSTTEVLTVIVDDINDNLMRPASKNVYLCKPRGGGSDAPLGRVYVDDPDDWDVRDKVFEWVGAPHPLFTLNRNTGDIFASSQVREGRYQLQFTVSDRLWGQRGVSANVTVTVKLLTDDSLTHATPLTITPISPAVLTKGWTPMRGGGVLGRLVQGILRAVGEDAHVVEVVSVHDALRPPFPLDAPPNATSTFFQTPPPSFVSPATFPSDASARSACVWVSVREAMGGFIDPVKLQGLLQLHSAEVSKAVNLTVTAKDSEKLASFPKQLEDAREPLDRHPGSQDTQEPSSAASLSSSPVPLQVVDINATSLVTPHLTHAHRCQALEYETCTPATCLNGGRCVGAHGESRCVCPGGSDGPQCKVLSRSFSGAGWVWVKALPPCLPTTISFRLLTQRPHALVLYSGPLAPTFPRRERRTPTPLLAVQVREGRPQVLLYGGGGQLKLSVNATVHDGQWHTIYVRIHSKGVVVSVDLCGRDDGSPCVAKATWGVPAETQPWFGSSPLQVGGLAHSRPRPEDHGWDEAPTTRPLDGCISHLRVNSQVRSWRRATRGAISPPRQEEKSDTNYPAVLLQLVDLGEPPYAKGSVAGCRAQEAACKGGRGACGFRGRCVGGHAEPECECDPGWTGPRCATPTVPAIFGSSSYVKMALAVAVPTHEVRVQLRMRTRDLRDGPLLQLSSRHHLGTLSLHVSPSAAWQLLSERERADRKRRSVRLTPLIASARPLQLRAGMACASLGGGSRSPQTVCVEGRPIDDGAWHTVRAERHGHNLLVSVDDGDGWRRNESLVTLEEGAVGRGWDPPVTSPSTDREDITVGAAAEAADGGVDSLDSEKHTCIDDVRVAGRPLPLPPAVNVTSWARVTAVHQLEVGCPAAADACTNTTSCPTPLSCFSSWGRASCSCGPGRQLVGRTCQDVDECAWRPCLHGGSCQNLRPGFLCVCGPGHAGDYCQWTKVDSAAYPLTGPVAIVALTLSVIFVVVVGVVFSVKLHRHWHSGGVRAGSSSGGGGGGGGGGGVCSGEGGGKEKGADEGGTVLEEKEDPEDARRRNRRRFLGRLSHMVPTLRTPKGGPTPIPTKEDTRIPDKLARTSLPEPAESPSPAPTAPPSGTSLPPGSDPPLAPLPPDSILCKDDLRAYAYEGDGSSSVSALSVISGLRAEQTEEGGIRPLVPGFLDVLDLLRHLPDGPRSPPLHGARTKCQGSPSPRASASASPAHSAGLPSPPASPSSSAGLADERESSPAPYGVASSLPRPCAAAAPPATPAPCAVLPSCPSTFPSCPSSLAACPAVQPSTSTPSIAAPCPPAPTPHSASPSSLTAARAPSGAPAEEEQFTMC